MRDDFFTPPEDVKPEPSVRSFQVGPEDVGARLDHFLVSRLECSRSQIQDWIESGRVILANQHPKSSTRLKAGWQVMVEIPPTLPAEPEPEAGIPLDIVYEDAHILVLNKQRGLTVHPGSGAHGGTLVNALLAHCSDLSGIRGVERPGIVHRLDKSTSGLMVVAKHDQSHFRLQQQFQDRTVVKVYQALVHGAPSPAQGRIEQPIARHRIDRKRMAVMAGGRDARTDYLVKESFASQYSLMECHLHTGRTHQIRVHLTWLGHPLVGDPTYGKRLNPFGLEGQALHCCRLELQHPISGQTLDFTAPMPAVLEEIVQQLRLRYGSSTLSA